ncbi:MAG: DUF3298 and DUF4163 domain-containing protein [Oscillospiraceae bacterium]|nr:DUF3298 and DUF4163 domain-containing protein [Oscillospiraceae bacterium]
MRKYSFFVLALVFLLASCTRVEPLPSVSPDASGEESALPANPTPPPDASEPPWEIIDPTAPPPVYPSADLAADWTENALETGQIHYQNTFRSGGEAVLTAGGSFPQTGSASIDAYYLALRDDFERLSESLAEAAAEDRLAYQLDAGFAVEMNAGGIYSVSRQIYQYFGGAHGSTAVYCETFSAATGRLLTLDDFFTVGQDAYTARLLEFVHHDIDRNPAEFSPEAKELARVFFPYETFVITPDGISLLFPEYNIAPFTSGIIRVEVPWGAVADIFTMPEG